MKTLAKIIIWTIALMAVTVAVLYGFWLVLIFMLFDETLYMWLAIAGEVVLFSLYFWLVRIASC
jgi:hypothetical protein